MLPVSSLDIEYESEVHLGTGTYGVFKLNKVLGQIKKHLTYERNTSTFL